MVRDVRRPSASGTVRTGARFAAIAAAALALAVGWQSLADVPQTTAAVQPFVHRLPTPATALVAISVAPTPLEEPPPPAAAPAPDIVARAEPTPQVVARAEPAAPASTAARERAARRSTEHVAVTPVTPETSPEKTTTETAIRRDYGF